MHWQQGYLKYSEKIFAFGFNSHSPHNSTINASSDDSERRDSNKCVVRLKSYTWKQPDLMRFSYTQIAQLVERVIIEIWKNLKLQFFLCPDKAEVAGSSPALGALCGGRSVGRSMKFWICGLKKPLTAKLKVFQIIQSCVIGSIPIRRSTYMVRDQTASLTKYKL